MALALYMRTLGADYVWDDLTYIGNYRHYHGLEGVIKAVSEPFSLSPEYYRPLAMLSFVISESPVVQHGINVLLHALNTVLVFCCARALMSHDAAESRVGFGAAGLGALAFAVHPLAVEPVAWVSGRFDTVMCAFVLGTCLVAFGGELTRRRLALVCALFACAMGSKESAIGLLAAFPFLWLLRQRLVSRDESESRISWRAIARPWAALLTGAALYVVARLAVRRQLLVYDSSPDPFSNGGLLDKLNVAALAVQEFALLVVNPWSYSSPLHPFDYAVGRGFLLQSAAVFVAIIVLALLVAKMRMAFPLALLAALAMISPALHLFSFPNVGDIISDRYALAPLALLAAGLAATAGVWLARRTPAMNAGERRVLMYAGAFGLLWAGALAAHSSASIPLWRNELSLWSFSHRMAPDSVRVHGNYVRALMGAERWEDADRELSLLLPQVTGALDLGTITSWMLVRAKMGGYAEAVEISNLARDLLDGSDETQQQRRLRGDFYRARGLIEGEAGHWEQAAVYMQKAFEAQPSNVRAALQYAHALFMSGDEQRAGEIFENALRDAPEETEASAKRWRSQWKRD